MAAMFGVVFTLTGGVNLEIISFLFWKRSLSGVVTHTVMNR